MSQTHSKMVTTRRRKQRVKKDIARAVRQAKKLRRHELRAPVAGAAKKDAD